MLVKDHPQRIQIDAERAKHWLSVGAQPTERVALFFGRAELVPAPARKETPTKSAPKAKAQERAKQEAELRAKAGG
jgi:small subunit ribosomal protein S16